MKRNIYTLTLGFICLMSLTTQAQTNETPVNPKPWAVEFNVVWPFVPGVEIYTAKATRTLWTGETSHGDLTFGALVRPGTDEDENAERFSEYGLNIGYRHYFIKGLHAELALYPSFARETNNKIDGLDYEGFALTTELYAGYRFNLLQQSSNPLYLMPQAGIGYNPISNLGPSSESDAPFPAINLQIGITL